ncbi:MAG TPA: extracellular solute-binding protein [Chloroflexota bacterium]|jgi:iron(III) transport system substrate-binding protein
MIHDACWPAAWRAGLVTLVAVLIGCAAPTPSAAPNGQPAAPANPVAGAESVAPAAPAGPAPSAEWDGLVAAARAEGKLTLAVPPGPQYEPAIRDAFGQAFPGIQVEMVNLIGGQFRVRVEKERAADQFAWDACICGPGADTYRLTQNGVFDPIMDDIVLPEVLDDGKWLGGIGDRFADEAKKYVFDFGASNSQGGFVNRDLLPESELASYDDLWKPQARGKIVWFDPRASGSGVNAAAIVLHTYGEQKLRELWSEQQVQVSGDDRQMAQAVVRGTRPIAVGMVYARGLAPLQQEGVAMNVGTIPYPIPLAVPGPHAVLAVNRPPHPNARKLFVNWLLTRDGQIVIGKALGTNSARLDVPVFDPSTAVPSQEATLNTQSEPFTATRQRASALARELFR